MGKKLDAVINMVEENVKTAIQNERDAAEEDDDHTVTYWDGYQAAMDHVMSCACRQDKKYEWIYERMWP